MQHKIEEIDLQAASYTPNVLLNQAMQLLGAKNNNQLAHVLECDPAQLCRIRSKTDALTPWLLMQIMDRTGWHLQEVRRLAGIPFDGRTVLVVVQPRAQVDASVKYYHLTRPNENRRAQIWQHICAALAAPFYAPQHTAAQHSTARHRAA